MPFGLPIVAIFAALVVGTFMWASGNVLKNIGRTDTFWAQRAIWARTPRGLRKLRGSRKKKGSIKEQEAASEKAAIKASRWPYE